MVSIAEVSFDVAHDIHGCKLILSASNKSCGAIITEQTGVITSPDWDQDGFYELNVNCIWAVMVDVNHVIRFQVLNVAIQFTYGCVNADYLEVITL